jgi:hypothetical protein
MKKQKKFNRKLKLNKATITKLEQEKVYGGATAGCGVTTPYVKCPCQWPFTY